MRAAPPAWTNFRRETFEVKLQTALVGGTPEAFASFLLDETNRWVPLIRRLGLKSD